MTIDIPCKQCLVLSMCIERFRHFNKENIHTNYDAGLTVVALSLECIILEEHLEPGLNVNRIMDTYNLFNKLSDPNSRTTNETTLSTL